MQIPDDVIYGIILVISLGLGLFVRQITNPNSKRIICTVAGVTLAIVTCHIHIFHSLILALGSCLLIKISGPRYKCIFFYISNILLINQ
jgi:hypothetical protein